MAKQYPAGYRARSTRHPRPERQPRGKTHQAPWAKEFNQRIHVSRMTWENARPDVPIEGLDSVSAMEDVAAFLLATTLESGCLALWPSRQEPVYLSNLFLKPPFPNVDGRG